jgi:Cu+-exporting ATPase
MPNLEIFEKVTTIVVDKTGTLTEGKPRLTTVEAQAGLDDATVLRLVASLETVSEHPRRLWAGHASGTWRCQRCATFSR